MAYPLVIVQARLDSARLPRKTMASIAGVPMYARVVERAKRLPVSGARVAVAWAHDFPDLAEGDVLGRFAQVLQAHADADPIIRVTADCPLWDWGLCAALLARYQVVPSDVGWLATAPDWDGLDVEIVSRANLLLADAVAEAPWDREHVTAWVRREVPGTELPLLPPRGPLRWSVDDAAGLAFARQVYRTCLSCAHGHPHVLRDFLPTWALHRVPGNAAPSECEAAELLESRVGGPVYAPAGGNNA